MEKEWPVPVGMKEITWTVFPRIENLRSRLQSWFCFLINHQFSSVQSLSRVRLFATPWTAAHQASLSVNNSQSLLKLMSIESVIPSNHLILSRPLLLPPSIFPSIRVFSNESVLPIRWPKYWSFSFSIIPSKEYSGLISFWIDWFDLWSGEIPHAVEQLSPQLLSFCLRAQELQLLSPWAPITEAHSLRWPLYLLLWAKIP